MHPTERRKQILESAARLIVARGNSNCSLDEIADEAGISRPLIFKYFARREDLLKALVELEFAHLREAGLTSDGPDAPLEKVVARVVERVLKYYSERGAILWLLSGDPAVAKLMQQRNRGSRDRTLDYFLKRSMTTYGVPEDVARIAVTMVVNAPILGARPLFGRGIGTERVAEVWSTFINGGWKALAKKYGSD